MESKDKLIARLDKILTDNKIKQCDFAKAIGVSDQSVSDWIKKEPKWLSCVDKMFSFFIDRIKYFKFEELLSSEAKSKLNSYKYNKVEEQKTLDDLPTSNIIVARLKELRDCKMLKCYLNILFDKKVFDEVKRLQKYLKLSVEDRKDKKNQAIKRDIMQDLFKQYVKALGYTFA